MSYKDQAEDVRRWMEWKGVGKAVVIGHSMGGKTAMALARSEGGKVRRVRRSERDDNECECAKLGMDNRRRVTLLTRE